MSNTNCNQILVGLLKGIVLVMIQASIVSHGSLKRRSATPLKPQQPSCRWCPLVQMRGIYHGKLPPPSKSGVHRVWGLVAGRIDLLRLEATFRWGVSEIRGYLILASLSIRILLLRVL